MIDRLQSTIEKHANDEDTPSQITKINCSHLIQIFGVCCTNSMINQPIFNINARLLFSIKSLAIFKCTQNIIQSEKLCELPQHNQNPPIADERNTNIQTPHTSSSMKTREIQTSV